MFSNYDPAATGQNRSRPAKAARVRSKMLRSSFDAATGTYNALRSSGSHEASKTPWRAPDWKARARASGKATRAARRRAAEDAELTAWGQPVDARADRRGPSEDHAAVLTPWEHSHSGYEYRAVAPCVVRVGPELHSEKTELVLKPGQSVRALERRIISGVTRLRIVPDLGDGKIGDEIGWASEETKGGKVLLRRVDWPPPEERAQAREAHANDINRQRALWLADEARQRRWAAKAGGVSGTVARYEAEQLEAAAMTAAALVPGFALGLQAHDKDHQDALEKVRQAEP